MVIGIRGSSGAGKSTFATMLSYCFNNPNNPNLFEFMQYKREADNGYFHGKWKVANFASTLKIAMATMYGIDFKQYEDGEFKDTKIGQTIWYLNIKLNQVHQNTPILIPYASRSSEEEIELLRDSFMENISDDVELVITSKEFTWRDTLNESSNGLHLYLGQDIALQAYQHRFDSSGEHLIMADVRKPREIDLIQENNGIIIEIKRNFVYMCSYKEAMKFLREKGYVYSLADGNNPEMITEDFVLQELEDYKIPVGIDCKPKYNVADTWLDGDDRADFIFHNPAGNPKNDEAYVQLFNEVVEHFNTILKTLISR